jgi:hypothetical protein
MKQKPPKTSRIHEEDSNGGVVDTQEGSCEVIWGRLQKTTHTLEFTYTCTMVTIIGPHQWLPLKGVGDRPKFKTWKQSLKATKKVKTNIHDAIFKGDRSTNPWIHGYGHIYCLPSLRQTKYIKIDPSYLKNEDFFEWKREYHYFIITKESTLAEFDHQGLNCVVT